MDTNQADFHPTPSGFLEGPPGVKHAEGLRPAEPGPQDYYPGVILSTINESPSAAPAPKVWAGTAGTGLGGAIGVVVVWAMQSAGLEVTQEVAIAVATICSIVVGFTAGYLTPPRAG